MSDPEEMDEQAENNQMNWFVAAVVAAGSPLVVLLFLGYHWAEIAIKVYACTAIVLGSLLLFLERRFLKRRWLWIGMIPVFFLHSVVMYGLVLFNLAFPQIDRFPVATCAVLVPVMALEGGLLYILLERFRPRG